MQIFKFNCIRKFVQPVQFLPILHSKANWGIFENTIKFSQKIYTYAMKICVSHIYTLICGIYLCFIAFLNTLILLQIMAYLSLPVFIRLIGPTYYFLFAHPLFWLMDIYIFKIQIFKGFANKRFGVVNSYTNSSFRELQYY